MSSSPQKFAFDTVFDEDGAVVSQPAPRKASQTRSAAAAGSKLAAPSPKSKVKACGPKPPSPRTWIAPG